MTWLRIALVVELRKARAARVVRWTSLLLVVGVAVITGGILAAAASRNPQLSAKLGPLADVGGWQLLLGVVAQITAAGAVVAFGVVLSWLVGREFADATITGLFALPVPRGTIALAKLLVYLMWVTTIAAVFGLVVVVLGRALGFGPPDPDSWRALGRLSALLVLTGLIAVPAAWAATLGHGLLPGIATAIGLTVIAQPMAFSGVGAWFPIVTPALWAITPASVETLQLALVPLVPLVFGGLTIRSWRHLQLDR